MRVTKPSGIEWADAIPEDWDVKPLFAVGSESRTANAGGKNDNLLSLSFGEVFEKAINSSDGLLPESFDTYQVIKPNDMVFRFTDLQNDKRSLRSALSKHSGIITSAYMAFTPRGCEPRFLSYLMRSYDLTKVFYAMGSGLRQSLKYSDVKRLPIILPPISEQQTIVEFLDRETAQIDNLIAKQEQLISTLGERRKALIAHVINRGLDENAPTKDTAIEQLGTVPNHWVIQRLRNIAQLNSGADYKDVEVEEGGFPVYGSGGIFAQAGKFMFNGESVLFGRKGTIDRPLYVEGAFWTVDTMYWTRFPPGVNVKFVSYWAQTLPFALFTTSTALPSMTSGDIKNFFVALPPVEEQEGIATFLDSRTGAIDALVAKTTLGIDLLKERRQALISAAVTGKIDVRG